MLPQCDPSDDYRELRNEIDEAIQSVCNDGRYILGPNVKAFESELATYCGTRFAVGVGNGTDALHLALRALEIGPGDEVITTPFTFVATTEAIGMVGATPVFVDIDPVTFNLDPALLEEAISPRTKAIIPVHLYGQPCDMGPIMEIADRHGLAVVEDCAQSMGATYRGRQVGAIGTLGCLSFFPSKNLGCFGDGGAVVTNDEKLFERVEMLRRHGGRVKYHHEELGLNSRLDELQAAVLRVKLPHLERWISQRRQHAHTYNRQLAAATSMLRPHELAEGGSIVAVSENDNTLLRATYNQYTILTEQRTTLMQSLKTQGVGHAVYYPVPLHLQKVHASLGHRPGDFPHAEHAAQCCLSLPMSPGLKTDSPSFAQLIDVLYSQAHSRRAAA